MHVSLSPHWSAPPYTKKIKNGKDEAEYHRYRDPWRWSVASLLVLTKRCVCANRISLLGKSSHCELLAQATGLKHLSVNQVVKDKSCHDGYDDELKSWIVDEDKVFLLLFVPNSSCSYWSAKKKRTPNVAARRN